jgi:hypothetical protein
MAYGKDIVIGDMRFRVTLASRQQLPDVTGTGIVESFVNPLEVWASVMPLGLQTFIGSSQIDTPITTRIIFRWLDLLDTFDVILRSIVRPDGSERQEIYRIRTIGEWQGRQRFSVADCELEKRDG